MCDYDYPGPSPVSMTTESTASLPDAGKRLRRERSYAGRAHNGNVTKKEKKTKKKGDNHDCANHGIPLFLQKTYRMITDCDLNLAGWTSDGERFVVKDPPRFAEEIIPNYFDHKKFSSFARQLNFYGFRKIQDKPVRNADIDKSTANYVTFHNENFKRDHEHLLCNIRRATNKGGSNTGNVQEQQRQIDSLIEEVKSYKEEVTRLTARMNLMEQDFLALAQKLITNQPDVQNGLTQHLDVHQDQTWKGKVEIDKSYTKKDYLRDFGVEDLARQLSTTSLVPPGDLLSTLDDDPHYDDGLPKVSNISSQPTLPPHPKVKSGLPPGGMLLLSQETSSLGTSLGMSHGMSTFNLRGSSMLSEMTANGLDPFEKRLFKTLISDDKDGVQDEIVKVEAESKESPWLTSMDGHV